MNVFDKVYEAVKRIPEGSVATYGQVAAAVGNPRLSRVVGYALHVNPQPGVIPCHRVVKRDGEVSSAFAFGGANRQVELLQAEGVGFRDESHVDMDRFRVSFLPLVAEDTRVYHPFAPLYSNGSRVLILGSFPSVKSREQQFFYGHPQNRFWKVISGLYHAPLPASVPEKKALILSHGLALWDTVASCEIAGSSDVSIKEAKPNNLRVILDHCQIQRIYCNGKASWNLYNRMIRPEIRMEAVCLPSTSPANAQWSLDRLLEAWSVIVESPPAECPPSMPGQQAEMRNRLEKNA